MSDIPTPETYNLAPWEFHHIPFRSAICPRCKGSGLDPDCTKKEISKGVRLSKSPATKWYVTDYPEEGSFAVTDGYEIFATISGGKTIGDECDLASRIAKLPDLERERDELRKELEYARKERDEARADAHNYKEGYHIYSLQADSAERERDEAIRQRNETNESSKYAVDYAIRERDEAREKMADALQEVDLRTLDFERMKLERDEARSEWYALQDAFENSCDKIEKLESERNEAQEIAYDLAVIASHCLGSHSFSLSETSERIADTLKRWRSTQPCKK